MVHNTEAADSSSKTPIMFMRNTEGSLCSSVISSSASSKIIIPTKTRADKTNELKF
jgi:hypothetical protein